MRRLAPSPSTVLRGSTLALCVAAILGGASALRAGSSALDATQQRCVNAVNKAFAGTIVKAGQAGTRCLGGIAKGTENASFEACSEAADLSSATGKVARAVDQRCEAKGVSAASTFAYTGDAAGVSGAAIDASRAALVDLLGTPAAVADASTGSSAFCQRTGLRELVRYLGDLAKAANQTKKSSLKGQGGSPATNAEELATALLAAPGATRPARTLERADARVAARCGGEDTAALFGGRCAGESADTLAGCAAGFARCRFCQALAAADGLPLDCGAFAGVACAATACGDGVLEEGEACDDGNATGGDGCRSDCSEERCGDGALDPTEGCDDGNTALGDGCDASCVSETCGDGVIDEGSEACDDGNTLAGDGCRANCTEELCGDDVLDAGEACDDGNSTPGDGCRGDCTPELCGDDVLDAGEACDDGNNSGGDGCRGDCSLELCGDGVVDAGEECDDENTKSGDGCSGSCALEACGDGVLGSGEACDDGNTVSGDGCRANCTEELCGDGLLDAGEGCDDGNTSGGDGCRDDCTPELCGDGTLDAAEQCDDGNTASGDSCDAACEVESCGDGDLDAGEECDDGNRASGDGCRENCTEEVCGDGIVDAGEQCDDGNTASGDGCGSDCRFQPLAPPDANFNGPLTIPLDSTASVTDFVSYPAGDTQDKVRWDISGMNPNPSFSGGRAQLILAVSCFGTGTQNLVFFTGGSSFSCGQTIVDREVTYDSRTGQVTITAVAGTNTYVQWVVTGTAIRIE